MKLLGSRAVLATAATLGLGLIAYALFSRPTDEERITELLSEIDHAVSFESPPNPLTHAVHLRGRFAELVTPDVRVEVPERGFAARGRDDLTRLAAAATTRMQSFEVSFTIESLQVDVDGNSAHAHVEVLTDAALGSDPRQGTRHAELRFVKLDGDWLLSEARVREGGGE